VKGLTRERETMFAGPKKSLERTSNQDSLLEVGRVRKGDEIGESLNS